MAADRRFEAVVLPVGAAAPGSPEAATVVTLRALGVEVVETDRPSDAVDALWRLGIGRASTLVVALGGDVAAVLADQLEYRVRRDVPEVDAAKGWALTIVGVDHERERAVESLLTIADGRLGTSGAPLLTTPSASPGVVCAGAYGGEGKYADFIDAPRWDRMHGAIESDTVVERVLDLRTGVLAERARDGDALRSVRFSSLARPGTAALRIEHTEGVDPGPALNGTDGADTAVVDGYDSAVAVAAHQDVREPGRLDRFAVYTRVALGGTADGARRDVTRAVADGFDVLHAEHRRTWARRWEHADVQIEGDDELQLAIRVALFHLMASVADEGEAAVGARGLSGHAYRGHVFWDADVFVLPFLAATHPASARAMLEYRLRRLPAARAAARAAGFEGARFPWESATLGDDVTPRAAHDHSGRVVPIRTGDLEVHIVADVAWAACCYADWSGDDAFAAGPGLELLVETARFWASRIRVERDGTAHLYGVIGPDEYHEPVDDNMFTNIMARWNLWRAASAVREHGGAGEGERRRWLEIADALLDGYVGETGVYEQCAGFFRLEPLLIAEAAPRRPITADLLLGMDRVRGAQVIKQPDVLMAHHLVPDEVVPGSLEANLDYYEPRTAYGSSLAPAIMASLLARAGRMEHAMHWLRVAATVDLTDVTATTAGGLHVATMGGLWQAVAWGLVGVQPRSDGLAIDPRLPPGWDALEVRLMFRGTPVRIRIEPGSATVRSAHPVLVITDTAREAGPDGVTFAIGSDASPAGGHDAGGHNHG